jgi:flagella basal body P-ring formation protein FlgA
MTLRLAALFWIARFALAQSTGCIKLEGDRIIAGDLAASLPAFAQLAPDTALGASPLPGVRRVFHRPELHLLMRRFGLDGGEPRDVCVERATEELDHERVLEGMRQALGLKEPRIEIVETSAYPVPRGQIVFRKEDLSRPALASALSPVIWRGNVIYGDNHRFSVWARVRIRASVTRVVAAAALKRGEPITASGVRLETAEMFPMADGVAAAIDEVTGRTPVRDIAAGAEVHLNQIVVPPEVSRGEPVDVEVRSGAARLVLTGKAETAGHTGDMITVRNPITSKLFQARVSGQGTAVLKVQRQGAHE